MYIKRRKYHALLFSIHDVFSHKPGLVNGSHCVGTLSYHFGDCPVLKGIQSQKVFHICLQGLSDIVMICLEQNLFHMKMAIELTEESVLPKTDIGPEIVKRQVSKRSLFEAFYSRRHGISK